MMSKKKITVLGSTGTIGTTLIDLLSAANVETYAVYRNPSKIRELPHIEWIKGDTKDIDSLEEVLKKTEKLFLLTHNHPGFGKEQIAIIEAAEKWGVQHIVKQSALGASPRTRAPLALEHWHAEEALAKSTMTWTILRPHAFMQNWLGDLAKTIKEEGKIYAAVGDGVVPFIDTRDIAAVAKEALLNPALHHEKYYVLTSGQAFGYQDLADALSKTTGKEIIYMDMTEEEMRARMLSQGLNEKMIASYLALQAYQRAGGATASVSPDVEKVLKRAPLNVENFAEHYKNYFM